MLVERGRQLRLDGISRGACFFRVTGATFPRTCFLTTRTTLRPRSQSSHLSALAWQNLSPVKASSTDSPQ